MSLLHLASACGIGIAIGFISERLALQKAFGGSSGCICVGIAGAFMGDFVFKFFVSVGWLPAIFYSPVVIVVEQIAGAIFLVYGWLVIQEPVQKLIKK